MTMTTSSAMSPEVRSLGWALIREGFYALMTRVETAQVLNAWKAAAVIIDRFYTDA